MSQKKCSGLLSQDRPRTVHFQWEGFDSISFRTRISTSSSPMFLGCWTDYELPGATPQRLSSMCIVRGVGK